MIRRPVAVGRVAVLTALALALAACSADAGGPGPATTSGTPTADPPSSGASAPSGPSPSSSPSSGPSPSTEPAPTGWGPTEADLTAARTAVAQLSVEELAGQVVVASYRGTDPQDAADLVVRHSLAGVILMADNVVDGEQVAATAAAVQDAVTAGGRDWPGVVAVDQEGGRVERIGEPVTPLPTFMTHGAAASSPVTTAVTRAAGRELRHLGVTVVLAPVADVTTGPDDPTIGSRAASDDPALVADVVTAAVTGYLEAGVVPVAKHYPGHGSVPADSHVTLPVQTMSADELAARDLVPFAAAAQAGVPAVMMSHLDVRAWDPGVPASLSAAAYTALRERTGFAGVAVTDALDMAAVTAETGPGQAAVRALAAGADLLLMPADPAAAVDAVAAAVRSGELPRERVQEAAARVVALLTWQGRQAPPDPESLELTAPVVHALSLVGTTVVDGPCSGPLVGDAVQVVGGTAQDRARFTAAAQAGGLQVGSGDVVRLLGGPTSSGSGDVVVALDAPYGLAGSSAATARLALYGRTPAAFAALVDVLRGQGRAGGRLPVEVPGLPRSACRP